ncbi:succinate dehydrogenase [ubiquinone] cytochrome b small subunit, mitochondrial-like [Lingula anatina]|uniref:Succinate dehydrogenase [ubiquinone] cytochrome b small subunit n=1 Tax=Lingula anatina TaxID=7574 RepID=A0A1S3J173_LINAN|nr:succinate dehydrogenase [ubiquinone] cytochrome b small subunit, mitochondrial-like [Lingula anatina]|eukprot:XP_013404190.1 succinate dehydrogenase [ubiquinone] cytochrome b small subunit, mitochondrial-like [Lingula anatina]
MALSLLRASRGLQRFATRPQLVTLQHQPPLAILSRHSAHNLTEKSDPSAVYDPSGEMDHDIVSKWKIERLFAGSMIAVLPAAFVIEHPIMNYLVATAFIVHGHWGLEGVFTDYIHGYPSETGRRRYPWVKSARMVVLYILTTTSLAGNTAQLVV